MKILFEAKTNILLYRRENNAYLIDSGNDKNLILDVLDYIKKNNLNLNYVINTHCHSDHTFYNYYLEERTDCLVSSTKTENIFIENSFINLDILFGNILKNNNYLSFKSVKTVSLPNIENLEYINLEGHSYDMIGILIEDKYFFVADSIFSLKELSYFPFIYDVSKFLKSLDIILNYKDKIIISSHHGILDNVEKNYLINKEYIAKTTSIIKSLIKNKISFDELFLLFLDYRGLKTNETTYFLYRSTFKSFLIYMIEEKLIKYEINDNKFYLVNFD